MGLPQGVRVRRMATDRAWSAELRLVDFILWVMRRYRRISNRGSGSELIGAILSK